MIFKRRKNKINLSYSDSKNNLMRFFGYFTFLCFAHIVLFYNFEDTTIFDSIWVTVISMTTVGYGDISASTYGGKISTMILVGFGIFVLANLADHFISFRFDKRESKRNGEFIWNLKNHIVIANIPKNYTNEDIISMIKSLKEKFGKEKVFQILTDRFSKEKIPEVLFKEGNIVFYNGLPSKDSNLKAVNIAFASHVIILSLYDDNDPDGYTFDVIHRIRDISANVNIIAQCQKEKNKERLEKAGANSVVRPVRAYPEIISHVAKNGKIVNEFIEDIMSKEGDDLSIINLNFRVGRKWKDVVKKLMSENIGLPMGYIEENKVIMKPDLNDIVVFEKIILLEYKDRDNSKLIEEVLK